MIWVDNVRYARVNNPDHGKANRVPVPRRPRSERVTVKGDGEAGGARAKGPRRRMTDEREARNERPSEEGRGRVQAARRRKATLPHRFAKLGIAIPKPGLTRLN